MKYFIVLILLLSITFAHAQNDTEPVQKILEEFDVPISYFVLGGIILVAFILTIYGAWKSKKEGTPN